MYRGVMVINLTNMAIWIKMVTVPYNILNRRLVSK